ncbi:MAG: LuxR C-terminal-related transcriptional regulator [Yoonia sp.]|uniref:LuxR C-terminal-related transcriptional regulator n=1 Tax=Yoonia sp. TaxID=2212373 RepID=UPI003EF2FAAF
MIRVAVIEDDPMMRDVFCSAIEACEDMILTGQENNYINATGMIEAGGYDVLLCDLGLPDGNGIDLIRQESLKGRDTDILVVTMFANQNKVLSAIEAGAHGYLLKDESIEDCMDAIRNVRKGGSPISPIIARQLIMKIKPTAANAPLPMVAPLSEREFEVLNLLARGLSNAECADVLSISNHTVGTHVKKIYRKLKVNSRAEALFEASSRGLLSNR